MYIVFTSGQPSQWPPFFLVDIVFGRRVGGTNRPQCQSIRENGMLRGPIPHHYLGNADPYESMTDSMQNKESKS